MTPLTPLPSLVPPPGTPVIINDPGCCRKTFPDYFTALDRMAKRSSSA